MQKVSLEINGKKVSREIEDHTLLSTLPEGCETIQTDDVFKEEQKWWSEVLVDVDTVLHLAWYTEPGKYLQSEKNMDCLIGTLKMAQAAVRAGIRRFVGVGTCIEYDHSQGILSVETQLKPTTLYAACKVSVYFTSAQWFESQKIEFAWCRLFYLYGEGEDSRRLVPYLHEKLKADEPANLTSGYQIRDYLDVKVAGKMIAEVVLGDKIGALNICSGIPVTVRQLAENIADEYGKRSLLSFSNNNNTGLIKHQDPPIVLGKLDNIKT